MTFKNTTRKARLEAKKALVLKAEKNRTPYYLWGLAILLMAGAALFWMKGMRGGPVGNSPLMSAEGPATQITYPADLFEDGLARHFQYQDQGLTIRYFILKSADGVIRAAFDACDVCWPSNKGYVQEGDVMICRNCGQRFASVRINEVKGGCNPAPLRRALENRKVILQVQDILEGKPYFNFS